MATRELHRSILLRLHSNRRELDRSLFNGLCCQLRPRLSDTFDLFDCEGHFPYYKIMNYGAVGKAAFGSLVVIMSLVRFLIRDLRGH